MVCYFVIFEVKERSQAIAVKNLLKTTFSGYCPMTSRAWAILTDMKPAEVRDKIKPALGPGGRLFVLRSGTTGAWVNSYGVKHNDWLKKYI